MSIKALPWVLLALALIGCDDEPAASPDPDEGVSPDAIVTGPPDSGADDDAAVAPADAGPRHDAAPPVAAWIEVRLDPRRTLYTLADQPMAVAEVFSRTGQPADLPVTWQADPPEAATVVDGAVRFLAEGAGVVRACVGAICGQAGFYVDDGSPSLVLDSPAQAEILSGFGGRTIEVRGRATDGAGPPTVRVNGLVADLGPEGTFSLDLPADFGLNRVVVSADDGVRAPAVEVRELLWAPGFLPVVEGGADVEAAATLRVDQALLDRDLAVAVPAEGGRLIVDEVAGFVGALVELVDGAALLADPQIVDTDALSLRVGQISLGAADVDAGFTDEGIELFVHLPQLRIETAGALDVEGEGIGLDGALTASMAAFASMGVGLEDGQLVVTAGEVGVAVESIAGAFDDPTADALVGVLGSQLDTVARDLVSDLVGDVVQDALPGLVEGALGGILGALDDLPLNVDLGIEGAPPIRMRLSLVPTELELARRTALRMQLEAHIRHAETPGDAPHPDPGVPTLSPEDEILVAGGGMGFAVRLALINALLHEVWRGGSLSFRPPLPEQFSGLLGDVSVDAVLPPVVVPAPPGAPEPLVAQIGGMRLTIQPDGVESPHLFLLSLEAGVSVRFDEGRFVLGVAEEPTIRVVLLAQGGDRPPPLGADALGTFIELALWPEVQAAIAGGLDFGLQAVALPVDDVSGFAPRVEGLSLAPVFDPAPAVRGGRLRLEGGLEVRVDLAPAP